ncbi:MAG TPA: chromate resistance protein ChrB domain-containing protein [Gammaproteobacteria bacterium]|nr:chromate resistance protein ChrB domain-containing protein [Gammaproteobacteria bacterium]
MQQKLRKLVQVEKWLLLAATLPGREASTARVRLWRTLKEIGAANLRDGVTLVPASAATQERLAEVVAAIEAEGGSAWQFEVPSQPPAVEARIAKLFDRSDAYADLAPDVAALRKELPSIDEAAARRRLSQLERSFDAIASIDFFRGAAHDRSREQLDKLRAAVDRRFSPEEPHAAAIAIEPRQASAFTAQRWATRKRLWVDRVASAWLIRRFIDRQAAFVWLDRPEDCPADAHGFDFDGAAFTHVGDRVTFEVLVATFGLENDTGLARLGALVHHLDVGGEPVAEAAGFEAVLAGLRDAAADDHELLRAATPVLDALYQRFSQSRD